METEERELSPRPMKEPHAIGVIDTQSLSMSSIPNLHQPAQFQNFDGQCFDLIQQFVGDKMIPNFAVSNKRVL